MRKNRTLTAAITTALSLGSGAAYAQGYQFENVNGATRATEAIKSKGESGLVTADSPARPNVGFDFTSGETVILPSNSTDGVPFAAELFGGALTLPTVLSAGNTGSHMAVVYTVDGNITQNFNMVFTLDSGATFAENPILGVKDNKVSSSGVVSNTSLASNATVVSITGTSISSGDIFRFSDHATIYQATSATTQAGGADTISFIQLGTTAAGLTTTTVTNNSRVYGGSSYKLGAAVGGLNLTTVRATTAPSSGQSTLAVTNGAAFTSGWSYICNSPSDASQSIFKVTGVNDSSTTTGLLTVSVAKDLQTAAGYTSNTTGGLLTTDCSGAGVSISRIHVPGDTVISLNANPAALANKLIQFGIISTAPGPFLHTKQYTVSAVDAIKNTITITSLATILKGTEPLYDVNIATGDGWVVGNVAGVPKTASSAAGTNKATFTLGAGTTTPSLNLATNDQIMLLYKLSNTGALAMPGQKINMSVNLSTGGASDVLVNPTRTVTVATSIKGLTATLTSIEAGKLNIAVSTGSTQFTGELSPNGTTTPYGFVSNTTATIGSLKVTDNLNNAVMEDGTNPFKINNTSNKAYVLADNSKLKVTGGQFRASATSPGKVFISAGTASIDADFVTQDGAGDWSALWNLDSTEMRSIADASPEAYIRILADGATEINTVENAPHAAFTIDYNTAAYKDLKTEGDLRKISKDGTVCMVYQIPPPAKGVVGADLMSIRVTNDSTMAAKVLGTLYDMDGNLLGTANTPLKDTELAAGATLRIESDSLGTIFDGATWTGRAVLKITSIMPQMEVMALVRQRNIPFAPLSNLSTGAKGSSCQQ